MAVKTFFCKLLPPRPTFAQVADPGGAYGMAIIEVADDSDARRLTANDPVMRADRGFKYEMFLMPRGAVHPPTGAA